MHARMSSRSSNEKHDQKNGGNKSEQVSASTDKATVEEGKIRVAGRSTPNPNSSTYANGSLMSSGSGGADNSRPREPTAPMAGLQLPQSLSRSMDDDSRNSNTSQNNRNSRLKGKLAMMDDSSNSNHQSQTSSGKAQRGLRSRNSNSMDDSSRSSLNSSASSSNRNPRRGLGRKRIPPTTDSLLDSTGHSSEANSKTMHSSENGSMDPASSVVSARNSTSSTTAGLRSNKAPNLMDKSQEKIAGRSGSGGRASNNTNIPAEPATPSQREPYNVYSGGAVNDGIVSMDPMPPKSQTRGLIKQSMDKNNGGSTDRTLKIIHRNHPANGDNRNPSSETERQPQPPQGGQFEYTEDGRAQKNSLPPGVDRPGAYSGQGTSYDRNQSLEFTLLQQQQNQQRQSQQRQLRESQKSAGLELDNPDPFLHSSVTAEAIPAKVVPQRIARQPMKEEEALWWKDHTRRVRVVVGICCVVIIVVVVVVVVLVVGRSNNDTSSSPPVPGTDETQQTDNTTVDGLPLVDISDFDLTLIPNLPQATLQAMKDPWSPQAHAFAWIMDDPNLNTYEAWRLRQRFALATFHYAMGGPKWSSSSNSQTQWLSYDVSECEWLSGSTCNENLEFTFLNITRLSGFRGRVPSEMSLLPNLTEIDLSGNLLNLPLQDLFPLEFLQQLSILRCSRCRLQGAVPSEIGLLSRLLKELYLEENDLTGPLPSEVGTLKGLRVLDVAANDLSGAIPTTIGVLTSLQQFILSENQISGNIPKEVTTATNLVRLGLGFNSLRSTIPTEIANLKYLERIDFESNFLTGTLPTELGTLARLNVFDVLGNDLSGSLISEFGLLRRLTWLGLSANSFAGSIPTELGMMSSMISLDLAVNSLTGPVPRELALLTKMTQLSLFSNEMSGTIPGVLLNRPGLNVDYDQ